jgi:hypothetical protein
MRRQSSGLKSTTAQEMQVEEASMLSATASIPAVAWRRQRRQRRGPGEAGAQSRN